MISTYKPKGTGRFINHSDRAWDVLIKTIKVNAISYINSTLKNHIYIYIYIVSATLVRNALPAYVIITHL